MRHAPRFAAAVLGLLALGAVTADAARAATFTPTTTADGLDGACDAHCTLREAIAAANAAPEPDTVQLGPGVYLLGRPGADEDAAATGDLDVTGDLTLVGAGATSTILDGGDLDRVLHVQTGAALEVADLTVRNGRASAGDGGGIASEGRLALRRSIVTGNAARDAGGGVFALSEVALVDSTIADNQASLGGGAYVSAELVIRNLTVSGNRADEVGGGLFVEWLSAGEIVASTVTANRATLGGGGLFFGNPPILPPGISVGMARTIVAGNSAPTGVDCDGSQVVSRGGNLVGEASGCPSFSPSRGDLTGAAGAPLDARLGPLAANGGPTPTHLPLAGSPAIDMEPLPPPPAGGVPCPETDQRGFARPADGDGDGIARCDAGAVEAGAGGCATGGATLCLDGRFRATASFRTPQGTTGEGQAVALTADTGYFWFFDPANVEVVVKALDACIPFDRHWVFLAGLTNVEVEVTVEDTTTGQRNTYTNPQGRPFQPILDTDAFATCP